MLRRMRRRMLRLGLVAMGTLLPAVLTCDVPRWIIIETDYYDDGCCDWGWDWGWDGFFDFDFDFEWDD